MDEQNCACDNGDMKPHLPRCPWYPREQALFAALGSHENPWADASMFQRISRMTPEEFAATYPEDRNVIWQRTADERLAATCCHFCHGPASGVVIKLRWPWNPVDKLMADEPHRFLDLPVCESTLCSPAVWRWPNGRPKWRNPSVSLRDRERYQTH